jgi:hypothetical protein
VRSSTGVSCDAPSGRTATRKVSGVSSTVPSVRSSRAGDGSFTRSRTTSGERETIVSR